MQASIKNFFYSLFCALAAMLLSLVTVILTSPYLYQLFNIFAKLHQEVGLTSQALQWNFGQIVAYLIDPRIKELVLRDFASSAAGLKHFAEVKVLIQFVLMAVFFCLVILVLIGINLYNQRAKNYYLKPMLRFWQILPMIFMCLAVVAFDQVFVFFHQVFFRNDLWMFDPLQDPIITVLPQTFFLLLLFMTILIYEIYLACILLAFSKKLAK